ncbi:hypothetical protein GCM10010301_73530 [Streptomyces plicatus]|nr:hypothetical protein GCM10010301_73530 [Streptomyces plicatus]
MHEHDLKKNYAEILHTGGSDQPCLSHWFIIFQKLFSLEILGFKNTLIKL